jgi:N-acetylmuramoyl-L-alanine amidase
MPHHRLAPVCRSVALVVALLGIAGPAAAQTAAALYERATEREKNARAAARPAVATIRTAATSFENVVRRYPRSGYADNALWQAAQLMQWAHQISGLARDAAKTRQLLTWLAREYPTSALAKQAAAKLAAAPAAVNAGAPRPSPAADRPAASPTARPSPPATTSAPTATLPGQILPAPVTLTGISIAPLPRGDRLTFELSHESTYTTNRGTTPGHVVVTLPNVGLSAAALTAVESLKGSLVHGVRLAPRNGGTEVEVRLVGQPRHSAFPLYGPYRLVIDIEGDAPVVREPTTPSSSRPAAASRTPSSPPPGTVPTVSASTLVAIDTPPPAPVAASVPLSPQPISPASTSRGGFSLARQLGLGVSRVVIDPGHGGHDPGALAHGLSEAEIVLDVGLRLEKLLQAQPGFEVVLTRRTNEFVALEERTAIANREGADLFLSIHANSSPQNDTRGVETYFLNFATTDRAEAVAARENAATVQSMRLLPGLVKAITLNSKKAESREFAEMIQASLIKQMRVQNKSVKDLGVKQAPFVVLIGAEMPSVLAELSFITNRSDATLLKQATYRQRVAQALADAVLRYQGSLKKVTAVAATTRER